VFRRSRAHHPSNALLARGEEALDPFRASDTDRHRPVLQRSRRPRGTQSGTMKRLTSDVLALHMLTSGRTRSTSFYLADSLLVGRCARAAPRHFPDQLLRGNRRAPRELIAMAHPDVMCPSRKKEDGIREVRGTG